MQELDFWSIYIWSSSCERLSLLYHFTCKKNNARLLCVKHTIKGQRFHDTEYNDNKFGWIDCSWSADNYRTLTTNIKISGSNGEIRVGDDFLEVFLKDSIGDYNAGWHYFDKIDLYTPSAFDIGQDGYSDQNQEFIRKIQSNDPEDIKSNIYNGCIIQKIISKIYKSSSQNKYIEFNG